MTDDVVKLLGDRDARTGGFIELAIRLGAPTTRSSKRLRGLCSESQLSRVVAERS